MRNEKEVLKVLNEKVASSDIQIKTLYRAYIKHMKSGNDSLASRVYNTRNNLKLERIKLKQSIRDLLRAIK